MLNQSQVEFILGMDFLGLQIVPENYDLIAKVSYLSQRYGLSLTPRKMFYDSKNGVVSSSVHRPHNLALNETLFDDVVEIAQASEEEIVWARGFQFGEKSVKKLRKLRRDICRKGIEELLQNIQKP